EQEIVNGIVPIREGREHGPVETFTGLLKESGNSMKFIPGLGRRERRSESGSVLVLPLRIFKQILAINQALGPVVIRRPEHTPIHVLQAQQRSAPAMGKIVGRAISQERSQIHYGPRSIRRRNPIGIQKGYIPVATPQSIKGKQSFHKQVQIERLRVEN